MSLFTDSCDTYIVTDPYSDRARVGRGQYACPLAAVSCDAGVQPGD